MCGIAGIHHLNAAQSADAGELKHMLDVIVHRGPDDEGQYVEGPIAIGMRRLSIIDLSTGHQPIHNEDRTVWVVFNGEIYNYQSLRTTLEQRGHRFYTQSDTETLVHLYEEHGDRLVEHLNGMYCFALWDAARQRLLLGRDRLGEKQLYYARRNGKLAFGSEIKCVLQSDVAGRDLDPTALDGYLNYLYVPAPRTIFADIRELPPAHTLSVERGELHMRRYWDLEYRSAQGDDQGAVVESFRAQFRRSVRSRLVADVPLGALLSGGIDSSAIVAEMAAAASGPVKTFCIGYGGAGSYYDERRYARMVAERFGTEHHEFEVQPDVVQLIPELVRCFDQPFADSSAIANYYVFRETRRHVKVVLSGLGGDEVAAGYERYVGLLLTRYYRALPAWLRRGLVERAVAALPESRSGSRTAERIKRFVRTAAAEPAVAYRAMISAFDDGWRERLYTPAMRARIDQSASQLFFDQYFGREGVPDLLNRALYADTMTYLSGDLLTLTDRMSMVHSIEARAPFVDHELVEFMAGVPAALKLRRGTKKHLLKQAFRGTLPDEILFRRKQGFTVPLTVWFRNELNPMLRQLLSRERIERLGWFDPAVVQQLIEEHTSLRENHHARIWALLMLMVWHEQYQPT
jgi:asparagine synthase (glutamine-hydrolysing)